MHPQLLEKDSGLHHYYYTTIGVVDITNLITGRYTHHFLLFFFVWFFHDLFRIKKFWIVGGLIYLAQRIMREIRGQYNGISKQCCGNSTQERTYNVGAEIGVTPFDSILKSIWYRTNYPHRRHISLQFISCGSVTAPQVNFSYNYDFGSFEWFRSHFSYRGIGYLTFHTYRSNQLLQQILLC